MCKIGVTQDFTGKTDPCMGRLSDVFQQIEDRFVSPYASHRYSLAELIVDIKYLDASSLELFHPSIPHLERDPGIPADWSLYVLDGKSSQMPLPDWARLPDLPKALLEGWGTGRISVHYLEEISVLFIFDFNTKRAIYWADTIEKLPVFEKILPYRYIATMLYRENDGLILHSASVGQNGAGVLIAGRGGMGKSTLSLAALCAGMEFVSDDCCLYHRGRAHSVTQYAKLHSDSLRLIPQIEIDEPVEKSPQGKTILRLYPRFKFQLVSSLKIKALIVPCLSNQEMATFSPCSSGSALIALAPSTLAQVYGSHALEMRNMAQLVRDVPGYKLQVGTDLNSAVSAIKQIINL